MQLNRIINADCLDWMREQPSDSVDLIFGSPPYEAARTYGIGFNLKGQAWVDWIVERIVEMVRICNGLVAMVVEGQTRGYRWSATPALLMADLHRRGIVLRKPPVFHRVGISGSGGPDWLRNDYEFVVCCNNAGRLPWSDNTAMGHPPKWKPGGVPSHRMPNGRRVNMLHTKTATSRRTGTDHRRIQGYVAPDIANPGNVIKCEVGGGRLGSYLAHDNEAPFPERLAEFFIRSFCPPGGIVLDPFSGSGTTARVAQRFGRNYIAIDVRQSQCELTQRRLNEPEPNGKPKKKAPKPVPGQRSLFPDP